MKQVSPRDRSRHSWTIGYQPPHLHVRPENKPRTGHIPGTEEHYRYDLD
ncbi:HNH/endonuclease VII fold putative polymorphic toxin [Streptomyces sp. NPDC092307]